MSPPDVVVVIVNAAVVTVIIVVVIVIIISLLPCKFSFQDALPAFPRHTVCHSIGPFEINACSVSGGCQVEDSSSPDSSSLNPLRIQDLNKAVGTSMTSPLVNR